MSKPAMITPITEMKRFFPPDHQLDPHSACAKIEMRYADCVQAYGIEGARVKCVDLRDDFMECCFKKKTIARLSAMDKERSRQYWAGERAVKYEEAPPRGFYVWP